MRRIRALFRRLVGKNVRDRDFQQELESHLQFHIEENLCSGMSAVQARREALMKLGGLEQTKLLYRDRRGLPILEILFQDIRFGARILRKNPSFTCVAVLTLALGIGANTAIFSVVNAVLFRPLPVQAPRELVNIYNSGPGEMFDHLPLAYPDYLDYRDTTKSLSGLLGFAPNFLAFENGGESEMITAEGVSANYFDVLGVKPFLGRTFNTTPNANPGPEPFVVLSYNTWQRKFSANPAMIGQPIRLNGSLLTVIGVAPPNFSGLVRGLSPGLWIPLSMDPILHLGDPLQDRGSQWLFVTGRLKPGVSPAEAQAEFKAIADRLALLYPQSNKDRGVLILPTSQVKILPEADAALYAVSFVVLAFVGLILLIACANIAGMLLARASVRKKEITVRLALGATRFRLIRQLLTESFMLSLVGGALGLLLTVAFDKALSRSLENLHLVVPVQVGLGLAVDLRVFCFTLIAVSGATLLFGLVPAFKASRLTPSSALKEESSSVRGRHRGLKALVVGQVAASLFLLICAGLSLRSMRNAFRVDPGFKPEGVITASFYPSFAGLDMVQARDYYNELTARVSQLPEVQSVSLTERLPLTFAIQVTTCAPQGKDTGPTNKWQNVDRSAVGAGYFRTMQIPILRGREFSEQDTVASPLVVIVNQTLANRFWAGQDPLGKKVRFGSDEKYWEVVGLARDGKYRTLGEQPRPYIYRPARQNANPDLTLLVRVSGDPSPVYAAIHEFSAQINGHIPVLQLQSLEDKTRISLILPRTGASLFGLLGFVGLIVASVGLYGVVAYTASQRTHEIGVRMALGAKPAEIFHLILREGLTLSLLGIAFGIASALAATRLLSIMLYGISPTDALTFACISLLLLCIALVASFVPAQRATRVDPMVALRYE
ncbi:MAG TPA: ABC transporter permease [Candidatus Acidoferrum sp.]|nr:ABC transporter permease [Candidatus Acidoferrum sp.]